VIPMKQSKLQKHIFSTYINMRYGVAIIAIIFPLLLSFGGRYAGMPRQDSMSAYYHANLNCHDGIEDCKNKTVSGQGIMRNYFVGLLFMLGGIFYLYKGYTVKENIALNLAGVFAIGVALFPMYWGDDIASGFSLHGTNAVLMFLCISYVVFFCAPETLSQMNDEKLRKKFRRYYWIIGVLMILSPSFAWLLTVQFNQYNSIVFFVEMFGIWTFAAYWLVKSREIALTNAEKKALTGNYK